MRDGNEKSLRSMKNFHCSRKRKKKIRKGTRKREKKRRGRGGASPRDGSNFCREMCERERDHWSERE